MLIKQINILVHPDYFQMSVPYMPFHDLQLALRAKWEERIKFIQQKQDTILFYFSNMTANTLKKGFEDISKIENKVERDEIQRIQRYREKLSKKLLLYGCFLIPDGKDLARYFSECGFTYDPETVKIYSYGEMLELCVLTNSEYTANALDIPTDNIEYLKNLSLTKKEGNEIMTWRFKVLRGEVSASFQQV